MHKKLQVFVSSTFTDMVDERQAAIDAILSAGHIPAGMEQFNPGDEPQKELIKRWIDESDVYVLLLGGRYGSIEQETGKSFTHWEYDFAGELEKPRFAIVLSKSAIEQKVKQIGSSVMEQENFPKYKAFVEDVLSKISRTVEDTKDIKLTITQKLAELEKRPDLLGWIQAKDVSNVSELEERISVLVQENKRLKAINETLSQQMSKVSSDAVELSGDYVRFLALTFDVTKGGSNTMVDMHELGKYLEIAEDETSSIAEFLNEEGLIKFLAIGGGMGITHRGVLKAQEIRAKYPVLNKLERRLLQYFFDKDSNLTNDLRPDVDSLLIGGTHELASCLMKMERLQLITWDNDPFIKGGQSKPPYNNSVLSIMFEYIHVTETGRRSLSLAFEGLEE